MTIKIKAPRRYADNAGDIYSTQSAGDVCVRIIRESDWRKLMRLVREVEATEIMPTPLWDALQALKEKGK